MNLVFKPSVLEVLSYDRLLKYGCSQQRARAIVIKQAQDICKRQIADGRPSNARFIASLGLCGTVNITAYAN